MFSTKNCFDVFQNEAFKPSLRVSDLRKGVQAGLINGGWQIILSFLFFFSFFLEVFVN